jgi:hypothetical protein
MVRPRKPAYLEAVPSIEKMTVVNIMPPTVKKIIPLILILITALLLTLLPVLHYSS